MMSGLKRAFVYDDYYHKCNKYIACMIMVRAGGKGLFQILPLELHIRRVCPVQLAYRETDSRLSLISLHGKFTHARQQNYTMPGFVVTSYSDIPELMSAHSILGAVISPACSNLSWEYSCCSKQIGCGHGQSYNDLSVPVLFPAQKSYDQMPSGGVRTCEGPDHSARAATAILIS